MNIADLLRPEIRDLVGYEAASSNIDALRLNANETPWRDIGDKSHRGLNRYPPIRPADLCEGLANRYGVATNQVLATRGSSEAIDVIIRSVCRPGIDNIVVLAPSFSMYAVYARIQGAGIVSVPLTEADDFRLDVDRLLDAISDTTRVVFLCSPNNPTGNALEAEAIQAIIDGVAGRALVVIDEAYREFCDQDCVDLLASSNVILLRTLSKAYGLAGVRCGALLADPQWVTAFDAVLPPYALPTPTIEIAMASLEPAATAASEERVRLLRNERVRLAKIIADLPGVLRVYPSDANFLLIRVENAAAWALALERQNILVRRFRHDPALQDCLRITVGRPQDNDRLLDILAKAEI